MDPGSGASAWAAEKQETAGLRSALEDAVSTRGQYYEEVFSFSVRFERDDSSAFRDTGHFQQILKMLHLSPAKEVVIAANDNSRSHYAGHAEAVNDALVFTESLQRRQIMPLRSTFEDLWDPNEPGFNNTDVIMILDSCFSGQATRGTERSDRSVEIVTSVGMNQTALGNWSTLARVQNKTFTSKLADEVAKTVGRKDTDSISFSELMGELRRVGNPQRLPEFLLKVGRVGIRIPIPRQVTLAPHLRNPPPPQRRHQTSSESFASAPDIPKPRPVHAIFKVHLSDTDPDSAETAKLVQWIYSLNPNIGLELSGVYLSRSTEIFLSAPWHVWALLSHRPGFALMCEALSPDLMPKILSKLGAKQAATSSRAPPPTGSENVPFRSSKPQEPGMR